MNICNRISRVAELGLVCYRAINVDTVFLSDWLIHRVIKPTLYKMSQESLSSCEIAFPDDSGSESVRDHSLTASTSLPERFSEITFSSNCIQKLVPGMCFTIKAKLPRTCERFSINLILNNAQKDIALHLNPRLPQNYVVRNSK